jgi:phosphoribosylglycinamide formyltransferase-1
MKTINIAILASGSGSNFETLVRANKRGLFKADIKLLITDKIDSYVRQRAKKLNIPELFINPKDFSSRETFDAYIVNVLKKEKINLVILAGYMRILSPLFVRAFKNKIINIHPALLPSFPGTHSIKRAYDNGCKVTGVTVHIVDEEVDHGPIILQKAIEIKNNMSLRQLESVIHKAEHTLFPQAIKLIIQGQMSLKGNRLIVK